jgi:hypothetical protein
VDALATTAPFSSIKSAFAPVVDTSIPKKSIRAVMAYLAGALAACDARISFVKIRYIIPQAGETCRNCRARPFARRLPGLANAPSPCII